MSDQLVVTREVDASPEQLFALLSDPNQHTAIDGSSMLRGVSGTSDKITGVGDEFIVAMNNDLLGDYKMKNTVTTFEPNRKIGWAPQIHPLDGYKDKLGEVQAKGHSYTWELEPSGSGTKVTQTYDWSGVTDDQFRGMFPLLSEDQLKDSIGRAGQAAK